MATRVVEGKKPYTGGKAITVDENKVISLNLRDENNLIIYDEGDDEIYVDLQLDDEITPTDAFPIGVNTGRVIVDNGWDKAGTIISAVTTSGDNIKILYADDGTLWMDNGTGTFKQIYFKADVDAIAQAIWNYIYANCNTKSFGWSPSAQAVYDRISSGDNYALVNKEQHGNGTNTIFMFGPTNVTTGEISSLPSHLSKQTVGGLFYEETNVLKFTVTDGVASNMRSSGTVLHNNGMLIVKADTAPSDAIGGTTWYNTTNGELKIYDGTNWNPVGGSDIEYVTQAEYNALLPGAESDNKHYFIYSTSGGGGWQPGVNTKVYYNINDNDTNSTIYDLSGNGVDQTWYGTPGYTTDATYGRVAMFNGSSYTQAGSRVNLGNNCTLIALFKTVSSGQQAVIVQCNNPSRRPFGITLNCWGDGKYEALFQDGDQVSSTTSTTTGTWIMIAATHDDTGLSKIYINGVYDNQRTISSTIDYSSGEELHIGRWSSAGPRNLNGQFKLFIGEDRIRTDQEIASLAAEYGLNPS